MFFIIFQHVKARSYLWRAVVLAVICSVVLYIKWVSEAAYYSVSPQHGAHFPRGLPSPCLSMYRWSSRRLDVSGIRNMEPDILVCNEFRMLGAPSRENEGKMICMDTLPGDDDRCVVMSLGSNNQWDFETAVFTETKCHVHTFDCSGDFEVPRAIASRVTLHHKCLGGADPRNRHPDFVSWDEMITIVGGETPQLLKADIEGWECELFEQLLSSEFLPNQIAFELHHLTPKRSCIKTWLKEFPEAGRGLWDPYKISIRALFTKARQQGYRLLFRRDNERCATCVEFTMKLA
eukprot:Selendium_serpulae@DN4957_c0_g1_i1.p1